MPAERIIAVDFGTSTSVIRVKRYLDGHPVGDRLETKPVTFNMGSTMVPTLMQKMQGTNQIVFWGHEAEINHRNTDTLCNFKVDIESSDPEIREQARSFTAEFFGFLARTYHSQSKDNHLGQSDDKERTIISYPVKWSDETKDFMIKTAQAAGFPNVEGIDEAQAAIQAVMALNADQLQSKGYFRAGIPTNILLIDMGAGTTDLVLCRYVPGEQPQTDILATWPTENGISFGGQEADNLLKNYICAAMPDIVRKKLQMSKVKEWKEKVVSPLLAQEECVDYFSALDDLLDLLNINTNYMIDRPSLENFAASYLRQLPELVNGCLNAAGMKGDEVDVVILTGGHSQWYFVREILNGKLGQLWDIGLTKIRADPNRIISISLPQETVALGLAYTPLQMELPSPPPPPKGPIPVQSNSLDQSAMYELISKNINSLVAFGNEEKIASDWDEGDRSITIVRTDHSIASEDIKEYRSWNNIASIHWTRSRMIGVRVDGTIMTSTNESDESFQDWKNITSISVFFERVVGLQKNGLVLARGNNKHGACNVQSWRDIRAVFCGDKYTAGLCTNGTVEITGNLKPHIQLAIQSLNNVVSIANSMFYMVFLCKDGTTIKADNSDVSEIFKGQGPIVSIAANKDGGAVNIAGLREDRTVVSNEYDVQNWTDIVSIVCGNKFIAGLKADGRVIAATRKGTFKLGEKFKDIIAISAYGCSLIAVNKYGSVIKTRFVAETGIINRFRWTQGETFYEPLPGRVLPFKMF